MHVYSLHWILDIMSVIITDIYRELIPLDFSWYYYIEHNRLDATASGNQF